MTTQEQAQHDPRQRESGVLLCRDFCAGLPDEAFRDVRQDI